MKITFNLEILKTTIIRTIQPGNYVSEVDGHEIEWLCRERNPDGGHRLCHKEDANTFAVHGIDGSMPTRHSHIVLNRNKTYTIVFDKNGYPSHLAD